jgi:tRNA G18 (ribose-2'-O)-methylase SpoU
MTVAKSKPSIRSPARAPESMRGYFGIGVEGISKAFNVGNLFRSAHAFGASFVFTVKADYRRRDGKQTDTSDSLANLPFYAFPTVTEMVLPKTCALVGVEFLDDAVELPSFHHPRQAAYVMGPERNNLSPQMLARCDHVIRIPTKFCLNVGIAGVIVMYDRLLTHGRFAARPLLPGGPKVADLPPPTHRTAPPLLEVEFANKDGARK